MVQFLLVKVYFDTVSRRKRVKGRKFWKQEEHFWMLGCLPACRPVQHMAHEPGAGTVAWPLVCGNPHGSPLQQEANPRTQLGAVLSQEGRMEGWDGQALWGCVGLVRILRVHPVLLKWSCSALTRHLRPVPLLCVVWVWVISFYRRCALLPG